MDKIIYIHKDLAEGRWAEMSFREQMGNIGSEVSRSLRAKELNKEKRMNSAIDRALELFDLSLSCNFGTSSLNYAGREKNFVTISLGIIAFTPIR